MIKSVSQQLTNYYVYDADNRILQHTRVTAAGVRDSVTFIHRNDSTIGSWRKDVKYYYIGNYLKQISFNASYSFNSNPMSRWVPTSFNYNQSLDRSSVVLLNSFDVYTIADFNPVQMYSYGYYELTDYSYVSANFGQPLFFGFTFKRTYDKDHYPLTLTVNQNGSGNRSTTFYKYY